MGYIGQAPANKAVKTADIEDSAITAAKIADGTVVAGELASDSVTTAKILNANVTTAKLAADAVDGTKIADDAIESEHYANTSIDAGHIASDAVTTAKILNANVTEAKIADDAITLAKMASGTDGNIISYDASGNPVAIATGNDGQILTSAGAGQPPAFETAAGGGGKILQVTQRETVTATNAVSTTTLTATDQYATITPSATSSNVIVLMNFQMHVGEGSGTGTTCAMGVKRDIGGAGYNDVYLPLNSEFGHWINTSNYERSQHARFGLTFLDAPNTTGLCTYKLYIRDMGTSTTGDNVYHGGSSTEMSTILMEVDGS